MSFLGLAVGIYFSIQAVLFWWIGRTSLRTRLKVAAALVVVFLVPFVMYVDGLYRELGDGGAANTAMSLLAVTGGFLNAFVVFAWRSVRNESSLS
jgi:hypothetical protein